MTFETRALGRIEIEASKQLFFPEGLFAFEAFRHFALLPTKSGSTFHWLQSLEETRLAFLVTPITEITRRYKPSIQEQYLAVIEAQTIASLEIWGIITVPAGKPENMTINLQGPILINREKKLGSQFVSDNTEHLVRTPLLDLVDEDKKNAEGNS
ncbi:MAG TPA: flagellar assembly protein FliW [Turneriella sp.]|nr:flagellar assembly protein FliW [Turneriella sp.]